ncbi:hypothetical protein V8F33_007671 [Rhypophila sp. PSN 637]
MPSPLIPPELGTILLTRIWLFQVLISTPITLILGACSMFILYDGYTYIYDFVKYLGNTILAMGIIFIVLVQRKLVTGGSSTFLSSATGRKFTFGCETGKSVLATALWAWILLDAIFKHRGDDGHYNPWQVRRIICCCIAFIVLPLFWYPTVWYSYYATKHHSDFPVEEEEEEEGTAARAVARQGERAPLLGSERV